MRAFIAILLVATSARVHAAEWRGVRAQSAAPADFALHIEAMCGDTIDTTGASLQRMTSAGPVSASVPMTAVRMAQLFELVEAAQLFAYPARYNPPFEGGFAVPYPIYKIQVQLAGRRHEFEWHAMGIATPEAKRLSQFVRAAYAVFQAEPAVQGLPPGRPCI